jgi:hypothetical protein
MYWISFSFCQFAKKLLQFLFGDNNFFPLNFLPKNYIYKFSHHYCLQHERVLKFFLILYVKYYQMWLNFLVDDCNLSNITKFIKKTLASSVY